MTGNERQFNGVSRGRRCSSLREAIHATATGNGPMKPLAAEMDWSPSEFCRRTTLGDDNTLSFPADDRLIRLQELTGDHSILITMADRLGYDVRPKADRYPELVQHLASEAKGSTHWRLIPYHASVYL